MVADVRESSLNRALAREVSSRKQALLDRLFERWFSRFVYNQIWEDPAVDLEALALTADSRVVTIASGGCNLLNYLTAAPAKIVALDLNPAHIALTRLKIAAMARLPDYEAFFSFFGVGADPLNVTRYAQYVASGLDPATRAFWETASPLGKPRIDFFAKGFYRKALLGRFIGFLHIMAKLAGGNPSKLLSARSRAEQIEIYEREMAPLFKLKLIRFLSRQPILLYSLGIPPNQFDSMKSEAGRNLADLYAERMKRLACDFDLADNYFAWQAFGRRYDTENRSGVPPYLHPDHYDDVRCRLDRLEVQCVSMTEYLSTQAAGSVDRYVLLDSVDWMDQRLLTELWTEITRTASDGARVIFRTAGAASVVEELLAPAATQGWFYDVEQSRALLARDRSAIYGGFHLYIRR